MSRAEREAFFKSLDKLIEIADKENESLRSGLDPEVSLVFAGLTNSWLASHGVEPQITIDPETGLASGINSMPKSKPTGEVPASNKTLTVAPIIDSVFPTPLRQAG